MMASHFLILRAGLYLSLQASDVDFSRVLGRDQSFFIKQKVSEYTVAWWLTDVFLIMKRFIMKFWKNYV